MQGLELQLNGLTPQQFLDEYWQKKPCLIRQGFPRLDFPLTPDEIAGLALEADVPSRILQETGDELGWSVRHGPFDEEHFSALPATRWTLLITDLEKVLPEMRALIEPFRFIPDWRIDDLMISYAADQGSVGPHLDEYDVFLIQVQGKRQWQINTREYGADDYLPNPDLKLLSCFEAEQTWVLEPGDILYLPPNIAHHGIAQGECMTCSVGFRAPAYDDMLGSLAEFLIQNPEAHRRYSDPGLQPTERPGRIDRKDLEHLQKALTSLLQTDDASFARWFGEYTTEPGLDWIETPAEVIDVKELMIWLQADHGLSRSSATRFAYIEQDDELFFFADGRSWCLAAAQLAFIDRLCRQYDYAPEDLLPAIEAVPALSQLILELVNEGLIEMMDDA